MKLSRILRRATIAVLAAGYYLAVVHLTGLSLRPTSMSQFFGHALIYVAAVGLMTLALFIMEQATRRRRE